MNTNFRDTCTIELFQKHFIVNKLLFIVILISKTENK